MAGKEYVHFHGGCFDGVKYKLARRWNTKLLTVIAMSMDEREDKFECTFVKNSKGETHTFYDHSLAMEKLNYWFPSEKIDPVFRLVESSDDDDDSGDDDLIIDAD